MQYGIKVRRQHLSKKLTKSQSWLSTFIKFVEYLLLRYQFINTVIHFPNKNICPSLFLELNTIPYIALSWWHIDNDVMAQGLKVKIKGKPTHILSPFFTKVGNIQSLFSPKLFSYQAAWPTFSFICKRACILASAWTVHCPQCAAWLGLARAGARKLSTRSVSPGSWARSRAWETRASREDLWPGGKEDVHSPRSSSVSLPASGTGPVPAGADPGR